MKKMTSRERVRAAAEQKPVDITPLMLWLEPHTLVKMARELERPKQATDRFIFDLLEIMRRSLPTPELKNASVLMAYVAQHDYLRQLGADIVDFNWFFTPSIIKKVKFKKGNVFATDLYGITRSVVGLYLETVGHPCNTIEELDNYEFPDLTKWIFYDQIKVYRAMRPDISIAVWVPGVQDAAQHFCGMENLYTWMGEAPEVIERFFQRLAEHSLQIISGCLAAGTDVIEIMDDYGSQSSLLISKRMWDRFTFPCLKLQCEEIKRHGGIAMLHSCGHVMPLLDRFAEAGVQMLHPFQPTAGNNLEEALQKFGDRMTFVTGIDAQSMAMMTPAEIRESILQSVRTASGSNGFVLCTTHYLQEDVPLENIKAMLETIKDARK